MYTRRAKKEGWSFPPTSHTYSLHKPSRTRINQARNPELKRQKKLDGVKIEMVMSIAKIVSC